MRQRDLPENRPAKLAYMKAYNDAAYLTPEGRADKLVRAARSRKKYPVTITASWVAEKIRRGRCEATGMEFDLSRIDGRTRNPRAPSIDRIDPNGPYSPENVQVVLFAYNTAKGEMADAEARALLKQMAATL